MIWITYTVPSWSQEYNLALKKKKEKEKKKYIVLI